MAIFKTFFFFSNIGKKNIFYDIIKRKNAFLVFVAQKGLFFVLEYLNRYFPGLYCLKKKKLEKWPLLDFLNLFFLQPRKAFFVLQYRKSHFPGLFSLKKKLSKTAIFKQKPWEKCEFFEFWNFFFSQPRKPFFRSKIS